MAEPSAYERYRRDSAQRGEDPPKAQRQADYLTLQMIIILLLLAAVWAAKFFDLGAYGEIRRLCVLLLRGDAASISETLDLEGIKKTLEPYMPKDLAGIFGGVAPPSGQEEQGGQGGGASGTGASRPRSASFSPLLLSAAPHPPVAGDITSPFGWRDNPFSPGSADFHTGLDIDAEEGQPIFASLPGTVADTGFSESYGNYIIIDHSGGLQTFYCHCSLIIARTGEALRQGERIALVGSTGNATGPHVHFEVRQDNLSRDPMAHLL